jgi:hypothetical protein
MPRGHEHHGSVNAGSSEEARALVHATHPDSTILKLDAAEEQSTQHSPATTSLLPITISAMHRSFVQRYAGSIIGFLLGVLLTGAGFLAYERFDPFGYSVFGDWILPDSPGNRISVFEDGTFQWISPSAEISSFRGQVVRLGRGRYKADIKVDDEVFSIRLTLIGEKLRVDFSGSTKEWRRKPL